MGYKGRDNGRSNTRERPKYAMRIPGFREGSVLFYLFSSIANSNTKFLKTRGKSGCIDCWWGQGVWEELGALHHVAGLYR
jgi:hypothetical protein